MKLLFYCMAVIGLLGLGTPHALHAAYEDVLIDFNVLGNATELQENDRLQLLYNEEWVVRLNSSADYVINRKLSYVKNVLVGPNNDEKLIINAGTDNRVLGIRVHFPRLDYNAYAVVKPSFAIRAFGGNEGSMYLNKGLIKNVGTIKAIKVYVKGRNFPHSLYVNLQDENFVETSYSVGHLNFDGWRELVWSNQHYFENVRDRTPKVFPRYTQIEPLRKINSLVIFRNGEHQGGDFITYISWVKLEYDKAYIPREEEIDDEEVWEIQADLFQKRFDMEQRRLNLSTELRKLELQKMNRDPEETLESSPEQNEVTPQEEGGGVEN